MTLAQVRQELAAAALLSEQQQQQVVAAAVTAGGGGGSKSGSPAVAASRQAAAQQLEAALAQLAAAQAELQERGTQLAAASVESSRLQLRCAELQRQVEEGAAELEESRQTAAELREALKETKQELEAAHDAAMAATRASAATKDGLDKTLKLLIDTKHQLNEQVFVAQEQQQQLQALKYDNGKLVRAMNHQEDVMGEIIQKLADEVCSTRDQLAKAQRQLRRTTQQLEDGGGKGAGWLAGLARRTSKNTNVAAEPGSGSGSPVDAATAAAEGAKTLYRTAVKHKAPSPPLPQSVNAVSPDSSGGAPWERRALASRTVVVLPGQGQQQPGTTARKKRLPPPPAGIIGASADLSVEEGNAPPPEPRPCDTPVAALQVKLDAVADVVRDEGHQPGADSVARQESSAAGGANGSTAAASDTAAAAAAAAEPATAAESAEQLGVGGTGAAEDADPLSSDGGDDDDCDDDNEVCPRPGTPKTPNAANTPSKPAAGAAGGESEAATVAAPLPDPQIRSPNGLLSKLHARSSSFAAIAHDLQLNALVTELPPTPLLLAPAAAAEGADASASASPAGSTSGRRLGVNVGGDVVETVASASSPASGEASPSAAEAAASGAGAHRFEQFLDQLSNNKLHQDFGAMASVGGSDVATATAAQLSDGGRAVSSGTGASAASNVFRRTPITSSLRILNGIKQADGNLHATAADASPQRQESAFGSMLSGRAHHKLDAHAGPHKQHNHSATPMSRFRPHPTTPEEMHAGLEAAPAPSGIPGDGGDTNSAGSRASAPFVPVEAAAPSSPATGATKLKRRTTELQRELEMKEHYINSSEQMLVELEARLQAERLRMRAETAAHVSQMELLRSQMEALLEENSVLQDEVATRDQKLAAAEARLGRHQQRLVAAAAAVAQLRQQQQVQAPSGASAAAVASSDAGASDLARSLLPAAVAALPPAVAADELLKQAAAPLVSGAAVDQLQGAVRSAVEPPADGTPATKLAAVAAAAERPSQDDLSVRPDQQ